MNTGMLGGFQILGNILPQFYFYLKSVYQRYFCKSLKYFIFISSDPERIVYEHWLYFGYYDGLLQFLCNDPAMEQRSSCLNTD